MEKVTFGNFIKKLLDQYETHPEWENMEFLNRNGISLAFNTGDVKQVRMIGEEVDTLDPNKISAYTSNVEISEEDDLILDRNVLIIE